jgi:hypothetical protein
MRLMKLIKALVGDNPANNENDKTAVGTITRVYKGGLDNLKKMMEGGS